VTGRRQYTEVIRNFDEREVAVLDSVADLFARFGDVTVKRMFGGAGLYADGLMFALVFDGVIYLRVDDASVAEFEREDSTPFVYPLAKRRPGHASQHFWRLPERLYDDPDDLAAWARRALAIAARRKRARPQPRPGPPPAKRPAARRRRPDPR